MIGLIGSFIIGVLLADLGYKTNSWQFWTSIIVWTILATSVEVGLENYKKGLKK